MLRGVASLWRRSPGARRIVAPRFCTAGGVANLLQRRRHTEERMMGAAVADPLGAPPLRRHQLGKIEQQRRQAFLFLDGGLKPGNRRLAAVLDDLGSEPP